MKNAHTVVTGIGSSEIDFSMGQGYLSKMSTRAGLSVTGGKVGCHKNSQLVVFLNSAGQDYASANGLLLVSAGVRGQSIKALPDGCNQKNFFAMQVTELQTSGTLSSIEDQW